MTAEPRSTETSIPGHRAITVKIGRCVSRPIQRASILGIYDGADHHIATVPPDRLTATGGFDLSGAQMSVDSTVLSSRCSVRPPRSIIKFKFNCKILQLKKPLRVPLIQRSF